MPTEPPIEIGSPRSEIENLLNRPLEQRQREYKYRFAQSVVFGLPVLALQCWGSALGPTDSERWVSLLQSLLCGWVLYVNLGMLVEGFLIRREDTSRFAAAPRGDFIVAALATLLYLGSLISALHGIITARLWYPLLYAPVILLLMTWSAWRWFRLARAP